MADDRDSLLREVEEEIRRERMQKIWERYNGLIIGGLALIVLGVGGYKFLEARTLSQAQERGADYTKAMGLVEQNKTGEALPALQKIADSGSGGYAALAKLQIAGEQVRTGKNAEALAIYEGMSSNTAVDPLMRDFAQLQAASLRLGEADFTEIENRLKSLMREGSAYKTSAGEFLGLSAFKAGKLDVARSYLEPLLVDPNAARPLQDRIKIVLGEIASQELAAAPPPKPATTGAAPAAPAPAPTPTGAAQAEPDKKEPSKN